MADDLDVEAMLEAPFKKEEEIKEKEKSTDRDHKSDRKSHKRSSSRKHRSRSRSRERSKKRSHKRRSRSRSRDRHRRRSHKRSRSRSPKSRRSREPTAPKRSVPSPPKARSPSPADRDTRTVFCMQLAQRIRARDLEEFFSSVGKVREVKLIQDKHSKRSKGIAYVEFKDIESVPLALGLAGQKVLGVPIVVQPTQSEKNKVAAAQLTLQKAAQGPTKLYVGGLHENITEEMLKGIFSPFGRVEQVQIIKDQDTGLSRGYAFITFAEASAAKQALDQLNGFEIAGRPIKLNTVSNSSDASGAPAGGPSFLDNDQVERAGIDLGTTGRLQLMAKLAEGTGLEVPSAAQQALWLGQNMGLGLPNTPTSAAANGGAAPPIATPCFQLSNMFDPAKETGRDWDKEIRDDVIEECERHGKVLHVYVDKQSQGNVYVKCDVPDAAAKSVGALHGRYFAGNMITAAYVPVVNYHSLFPEAAYATTPIKTNR